MKKLLAVLMLLALFVSCSSDDDNTDPNNGNNNGMIDEKILGKWKVEYSKTIKPAVYNETTGKVEYDEKEASITEYEGNYGEIGVEIKSGLFSSKEVDIEITKDKKIISNSVLEKPITLIFDSMKDGLITKQEDYSDKIHKLKYRFEKEKLIIETITPEYNRYNYTISEYSKIK